MNDENDWDHNVEGDSVEVPVNCVFRDKVMQMLIKRKRNTCGPLDVSLELIAASGELGIQVKALICQSFKWTLNVS